MLFRPFLPQILFCLILYMAFPARSRHSGKKPVFEQVDAALAFKVKKSIVMVGMMGAGKTAVGQALASRLKVPFLDSDEEIVRAANMSIAEIFDRDGERFFRDRETEVIGRLLDTERAVLSTGGGAFMSERNRSMIAKRGVAVWLKADLDLLWNRVKHKDTRPLLRTADPKATLTQLYNTRVPVYALADLKVEASASYSIADMADAVVAALLTRPDVLEEI
ncbi:shikimate kinase [uncultured Aliiroseovarius sp.]|uniref:shikimate kinase n=1 Tax=uncultured Aliiroseovarius sp. TaxID=1658783 RepID=UPI0034209331